MAYDPELADRLRELLGAEPDLTERAMFGGLAFLVAGHMAVCAASKGSLMLRIDPADAATLDADPRVGPMRMNGRDLSGWRLITVDPDVSGDELGRWVDLGVSYARSLPPKG